MIRSSNATCKLVTLWALAISQISFAQDPRVEIRVSQDVVGRTPVLIGYNLAHHWPGSNTSSWLKRSGVNAARLYTGWSLEDFRGNDSQGAWGDGVADKDGFWARRAALRKSPEDSRFINWRHHIDRLMYRNLGEVYPNNCYIDYQMRELKRMDMAVLANLHIHAKLFVFQDGPKGEKNWADRWEFWVHNYALAYWAAKNYDTEMYLPYNEPDHRFSDAMSQAEFIERLRLASDAIQSACADVNARYGKSLKPNIVAPTLTGGESKFHANTTNSSNRDDEKGWGELCIDNLHTDLFGRPDPSFTLFHTYNFHSYNRNGKSFGEQIPNVRRLIADYTGGRTMPIWITEFNAWMARTFAEKGETLDTPVTFTKLASQLAYANEEGPEGLFVFKFGMTASDQGAAYATKKNGTHHVANFDEPYNVGGSSKGAEAFRLYARNFKDGRLRYGTTVTPSDEFRPVTSCFDPASNSYYIYAVNRTETAVDLRINMSAWDVAPGTLVTVEEVSARYHDEISQIAKVSNDGTIDVNQPDYSVLLLTVSKGGVRKRIQIAATEDTTVIAGKLREKNFGRGKTLDISHDSAGPDACRAAYMKFSLKGVDLSKIGQAVLELTGSAAGERRSDPQILHVYGIMGDDWNESDLTWASAPDLADPVDKNGDGKMASIADNFVKHNRNEAHIAGHITVQGSKPMKYRVDVTDFVSEQHDDTLTFMIVREVRLQDDVSDGAIARLASKEGGGGNAPRLVLFLKKTAAVDAPRTAHVSPGRTTYYVDGEAGDDMAAGTSPAKAWRTFARVNDTTFASGDGILLKAGCVWSGEQLWPKGSGSEAAPITVGRYGQGPRPLLNGNGKVADVVRLHNQEYWEIGGLEITNFGEDDEQFDDKSNLKRAVYVSASDSGEVNHIRLHDLDIHDVNSSLGPGHFPSINGGGIFCEIIGRQIPTWFDGLTIEDCNIRDVDRTGIANISRWWSRTYYHDRNWAPSRNVVVRNNTFTSVGGNGLIIRCSAAALIEHNTFAGCGSKISGNAMFVSWSEDALVQYNEAYGQVWEPGETDGSGFDIDVKNKGAVFQYNYSHDNGLGGFVICTGQGDPDQDFNWGAVLRYNLSVNNVRRHFYITGAVNNALIYNNLIHAGENYPGNMVIWQRTKKNGGPANTQYFNNIFYNMSKGSYYKFDDDLGTVFDHNLFYGQHSDTEPAGINRITADPQLVAPGRSDNGMDTLDGYKLRAGSPCIDAGLNLQDAPGRDFWGNVVPYNGVTDIGPHEFSKQ